MYKVIFNKRSLKQLKEIDNPFKKNILEAIKKLAEDPYKKSNVKKIIDYYEIYRLRVGNYRIKYVIEDHIIKIEIVDISHRKDTYRK